jgi:hypothetical protein
LGGDGNIGCACRIFRPFFDKVSLSEAEGLGASGKIFDTMPG